MRVRQLHFLFMSTILTAAGLAGGCSGTDPVANVGHVDGNGTSSGTSGASTSSTGGTTTSGSSSGTGSSPGTGSTDASPSDTDGATHDAASADAAPHDAGSDAASTCIKGVPSPGSGHHNPGDDCAGCHDSLSASRRWTVSGTLFATANGGAAVSGATIELIDAAGQVLHLPTYSNGNFYTITPVKFPLKVRATKCPSDVHMAANAAKGSCNTNGCHDTMRIHLP
jgi:hypothetical protein